MPTFQPVTTLLLALIGVPSIAAEPTSRPAIVFNTNFDGASLGKVEALGGDAYRLNVPGQYDNRGRNRQTSWFYFRIDNVAQRPVTLTMTDLIGEYNDRPGAVPFGPDIVPVWSVDQKTWTHFKPDEATWDAEKKELTLKFAPAAGTVWVAHVPPYVAANLSALLDDARRSPVARVEVIGKTVNSRDIPMISVTDPNVPDAQKRCVWLQARQHAWEAGTSWVMDGAVRWAMSDEAEAVDARKKLVFRFTPMVDLDGVAAGKVRFNANGFDVNRHWPSVNLEDPEKLKAMPEIWYTKKAVVSAHALGPKIDLLVNLHNTETGEYLQTFADDDQAFTRFQKLHERLVERTAYEPSRPFDRPKPKAIIPPPTDTMNSLWQTHGVPVALMELRVGTVKKLDRRRTVEDWKAFGRELISEMAK